MVSDENSYILPKAIRYKRTGEGGERRVRCNAFVELRSVADRQDGAIQHIELFNILLGRRSVLDRATVRAVTIKGQITRMRYWS